MWTCFLFDTVCRYGTVVSSKNRNCRNYQLTTVREEAMDIPVIGSGGREHAIAWALGQTAGTRVVCVPGNPGMRHEQNVVCADFKLTDHEALVGLVRQYHNPITVVGPEAPLAAGIVDDFLTAGLKIVGPTREAAQLETSKVWAAEFLRAARVPIPRSEMFYTAEAAMAYVGRTDVPFPLVIKADGIAAGKGVVVARTLQEAIVAIEDFMIKQIHGEAGERIVIQEYIEGYECSMFAFVDGEHMLFTIPSQDHKCLHDGDQGPNTGGMGAYAPIPQVGPELQGLIREQVFWRTLREFQKRGITFRGILYAGLIITPDGRVYLLEWNVRMGDPETQPTLMLLDTPLTEIMDAIVCGRLNEIGSLRWKEGSACCIVLAADGYAERKDVRNDDVIEGLDEYGQPFWVDCEGWLDRHYFHAGTTLDAQGRYVTKGGRIGGMTIRHRDLRSALWYGYLHIGDNGVHFPGMQFRHDIGKFGLQK